MEENGFTSAVPQGFEVPEGIMSNEYGAQQDAAETAREAEYLRRSGSIDRLSRMMAGNRAERERLAATPAHLISADYSPERDENLDAERDLVNDASYRTLNETDEECADATLFAKWGDRLRRLLNRSSELTRGERDDMLTRDECRLMGALLTSAEANARTEAARRTSRGEPAEDEPDPLLPRDKYRETIVAKVRDLFRRHQIEIPSSDIEAAGMIGRMIAGMCGGQGGLDGLDEVTGRFGWNSDETAQFIQGLYEGWRNRG